MSIWITWALYFVAFVYNILDVYHTHILLNLNVLDEMNPLIGYMIDNIGISSAYFTKIALFIMLGLALLIHQIRRKHDKN